MKGQAGFKAYFPAEHVVQHVLTASINEDIVYSNRYDEGYDVVVSDWLSRTDGNVDEDMEGGDMEVDSTHEESESEIESIPITPEANQFQALISSMWISY